MHILRHIRISIYTLPLVFVLSLNQCTLIRKPSHKAKQLSKYHLCNNTSAQKEVYVFPWDSQEYSVRSVKTFIQDTLKIEMKSILDSTSIGKSMGLKKETWNKGECKIYLLDINENEKAILDYKDSFVILLKMESSEQCFILDHSDTSFNNEVRNTSNTLTFCNERN